MKLLNNICFDEFCRQINIDLDDKVNTKMESALNFEYFQFYTSISSVYSSKIEGESIEVDSFIKHKFLHVKYEPDYTKRADDLFLAYQFMLDNELTIINVFKVHELLSNSILMPSQRGVLRINPMFVLNEEDRIEYVACHPKHVEAEFSLLMEDIQELLKNKLSIEEVFYYASLIHLVFVKIHPFNDGNGRTARLIEKWFLYEKLGKRAISVEIEKNYFNKRDVYYRSIRKIGLEYETLDYSKSLDFLLMSALSLV